MAKKKKEVQAVAASKVESRTPPVTPEEVDVCDSAWLKWCGQHLDQKPFDYRRLGRKKTSPEAHSWREYLMYALLKIRGKSGHLQELLLNRAQRDLERTSTNRNIVLKARQLG